jgi:RimJ/RimL family protein N-acetyltransferase
VEFVDQLQEVNQLLIQVQHARYYGGMPKRLGGYGLALVPLEEAHAESLMSLAVPETFRYIPMAPKEWSLEGFRDYIRDRHARGEEAWLVEASGRSVGSTAFLLHDQENGIIEVGATFYAPDACGTRVNPACKRLVLGEAFEARSARKVILKCDARNQRSLRAIQRLGAVPEGIHRSAMILSDGTRRRTAFHSILDDEWPEVKRRLEMRLAE